MTRKELLLASLLAAAAAAPRAAWGQATCTEGLPHSPDGTLCMAEDAITAGGGCMKDSSHDDRCTTTSGINLSYLMGKFNQPMTGGSLKIWPGVLAAVTLAQTDVSRAHAFPTPFVPSQGHTRIMFSALPPEVTIKIFTLSGHLVKTLSKSDNSDRLAWTPVNNDQGSPVASGVYFFIVQQAGGGKKKGKLMIIR
ncbi:MAG: T9SS type A sorting domain-containing protein [Elusimicrobia bacterium]|nr:T9SS type A sorting domain-containing protein [Elusimicrobiota bacterium]